MRSERAQKSTRYWFALVFLVLGTMAGVWHNRRVAAGKPDYVAGAARSIVAIPAVAFRGVSGWFGRQTEWITQGRRLASENRRLREQVAALQGQNNELKEASIDLDRLRADIGFTKTAHNPLIAADVIAMRPDPKFDTLIISRGSADGIKQNSVVVTRDGVVGQVFEVEPDSAAVLMLTDQKSGIGAKVQRAESRATAVCEGDNTANLSMMGLTSTADVRVGDTIVTSGLGGVYPGGLLVGSVTEVQPDSNGGGKTVRVKPQVMFDKLEQVYVIP